MQTFVIPNTSKKQTDAIITASEKKWIREKSLNFEMHEWLERLPDDDLIAVITGNLRDASQATRTRLHKQQLISTRTEHARFDFPEGILTDTILEAKTILYNAKNPKVEIYLERTGTHWQVYPLFFKQFKSRLLALK